MKVSELMYEAIVKKYESDMADAKARIYVYLNNPVAIGEHPQHTEELDKLIEQYASAKDKMENIKTLYTIIG